MNNTKTRFKYVDIKQHAHWYLKPNTIPVIKSSHFILTDLSKSLDGAAPKQTAQIYCYKKGIHIKQKNWPHYIIKTGHKNYPVESITEQLFTDVGKCFGLEMADTFLGYFSGQIRIASRYFLNQGQKLVNGAEIIYTNHLDNDINIQLVYEFLKKKYKENSLFISLVKLLIFDAITGNNDRHFYNWGVIETGTLEGKNTGRFSPIYDTARGLFWNTAEEKLAQYQEASKMQKYINHCKAKISYDSTQKITLT